MPLTFLHDRSRTPEVADLDACLGKAKTLWANLIQHALDLSPPVAEVWGFASPKYGWSLRLVQKDRILLYLTPGKGEFSAGIALGRKVVAAAREQGLSAAASAIIDAAPVYAEGHGIRTRVASKKDVEVIKEFLAIKVSAPPRRKPR